MKDPVAMPTRFDRIEAVRAAEYRQTWSMASLVWEDRCSIPSLQCRVLDRNVSYREQDATD